MQIVIENCTKNGIQKGRCNICGIFGFISDCPSEENLRVFKDLCHLSAIRGTDSTGIAIVSKGKVIIDKEPIPSPEFIKKLLPKYEKLIAKSNLAIGHTRKWTQGKPNDNNNNHPVVSNNWLMVHNGMCSSMDRIKDYKYNGEVDSEILLSYVEKYGIAEGLSYLQGYAAVASINTKTPNDLYLWRHKEDIYLGYDRNKSTLFFCSSEDIAEAGLANELLLFSTYQVRELPEDNLYKISHSPLHIEEIGEIEVKKPVYKNIGYTYGQGKFGNNFQSVSNIEKKVGSKWTFSSVLQCLLHSTGTDVIEGTVVLGDKYYFKKQSADFVNWKRVNKCFVSPDGLLIKAWDKDKATHYIMTLETAIKEKLLPDSTLKLITSNESEATDV